MAGKKKAAMKKHNESLKKLVRTPAKPKAKPRRKKSDNGR